MTALLHEQNIDAPCDKGLQRLRLQSNKIDFHTEIRKDLKVGTQDVRVERKALRLMHIDVEVDGV